MISNSDSKKRQSSQSGQTAKKLRSGQLTISYQIGYDPMIQGHHIDFNQGLSVHVKERGLSFIEASLLIIKQISPSTLDQAQAIIEAKQKDWIKGENQSKEDLLSLEQNLIITLQEHGYQSSKSFKQVKTELENAENHINWKTRQTVITTYDKSDIQVVRTETPLSAFTPEQEGEWLKILTDDKPDWFSALSQWEQSLLSHKVQQWHLNKEQNLGDFLGTVPTTIRRYPGTPNAYKTSIVYNLGDDKPFEFSKIRTGILAPFNMDDKHFDQKVRVTYQNLCQMVAVALQDKPNLEGQTFPILLQTLFSPPFQPESDKTSNHAMQKAIEQLRSVFNNKKAKQQFLAEHGLEQHAKTTIQLLFSNRPVNSIRALSRYWVENDFIGIESQNTANTIETLVEQQCASMSDSHPQKHMALNALKAYKGLLNQVVPVDEDTVNIIDSMGPTLDQGMELLENIAFAQGYYKGYDFGLSSKNFDAEIAALEQILMNFIGVRIGSCISGKDREEMITMFAASQIEHYLVYGEFPPAPNQGPKEDRRSYHSMLAHHYLSGHGMKLAAENARGSNGLKCVPDLMGKEICDVIIDIAKKHYDVNLEVFHPIITTDKIAGLNKPKPKEPKPKNNHGWFSLFKRPTKSQNSLDEQAQISAAAKKRQ